MPDDVFDLLFVCTGNICRSPTAELLAAAELRRRLGAAAGAFRVHSAGTHGLVGHAIDPPAARVLDGMGVGSGAFRARRLDAALVEGADLVLTATRQHRSAAVSLVPRAAGRTFTLKEFARLVAAVDQGGLPVGDPVARARALVAAAAARRGFATRPAYEDDVADPYGGPAADFATCTNEIAEALRGPLEVVCAGWDREDA